MENDAPTEQGAEQSRKDRVPLILTQDLSQLLRSPENSLLRPTRGGTSVTVEGLPVRQNERRRGEGRGGGGIADQSNVWLA